MWGIDTPDLHVIPGSTVLCYMSVTPQKKSTTTMDRVCRIHILQTCSSFYLGLHHESLPGLLESYQCFRAQPKLHLLSAAFLDLFRQKKAVSHCALVYLKFILKQQSNIVLCVPNQIEISGKTRTMSYTSRQLSLKKARRPSPSIETDLWKGQVRDGGTHGANDQNAKSFPENNELGA